MAFRNLQDVIYALESYGLTDVLLPFILVFTLVFAIMQKVQLLGPGKKNLNVVVALIMALLVIIPHVVPGTGIPDVVNIINRALPQVSILVVAIIMVFLLIGLFGGKVEWMGTTISGWIAILAFVFVAIIFANAAGWLPYFDRWRWYLGDETISLLLIVAVFGLIIWFICKEPAIEEKGKVTTRIMEELGKLFGGGGK
jgi:hypothetical protein